MSGTDPIDLIDGLTTSADVSKSETRAELLAAVRNFPTAANVANWDLSGRSAIYIAEYQRVYAKDTGDTTTATSESLVRDINGLAFKVIDASGERVAFRAHKTGAQTLASDTAEKILFDTASINVGSYYNTSTSRAPLPAGLYLVGARISFSGGLVDQNPVYAMIYQNGAAVDLDLDEQSGTAATGAAVIGMVQINDGDYIEAWGRVAGAGTKTVVASGVYTNFWAFKVDGVKGESGQSLNVDFIVADITERDTHGGAEVGTLAAFAAMNDCDFLGQFHLDDDGCAEFLPKLAGLIESWSTGAAVQS